MAHVLDDVHNFKKLVLSGVPKIFRGEEFESTEEHEAVTLYIQRFGFQMDPWTGRQLETISVQAEYTDKFIEGIVSEIHNTFRGNHGI